ncbi:Carboxypeptidase inhibitor SmCI [Lamellibrachia satsuma]|nr:Carboxypeptidase inhibitor SmCI [Lamellibrachia satsuma]
MVEGRITKKTDSMKQPGLRKRSRLEVIFLWCVLFLGLVAVATAHRYRPRFCYLPAKAGNCEAAIPSWFYNCATCACEKFIYGGCGGNRNRFDTELACRRRCKAKCKGLVSCDLKCKSGFVKDLEGCPICQCVDACENVKCSYREQCVAKVSPCLIPPCPEFGECVDMCYLSKETDLCRGRFRRWFYNKDHCQQFIYGGCGGNKNNFPDQATCLRKCRCPRLTCDKEC